VSSKLLEERQAEMGAFLSEKKSENRQSIHVEEKPAIPEPDSGAPREQTIVKQPNGSSTVSHADLYHLI
jgi:hypothetical protein